MRGFFLFWIASMAVASIWMARSSRPDVVEGRTLLVWTSDDNPLRKEQVELFNRLNPDLELVLDPANEAADKVIVQSLGGAGPDLFDCRSANSLVAFVRAGIAMDTTEELAARGIDVRGETWPAMHPMAIYEGRVYGVPTNVAASALWFNRDLLAREGIVLPRDPLSWQEFIPIAQRLTKRDARGKIIQAGFVFDWYNWLSFLYGFGGRVYSEDGKRCLLDSDEAVAALQLMQDLVYVHRVSPSPVEEASMATEGGWGADNINFFGAGRAATALGGRWWLANLRRFEGLRLGVCESPNGGYRSSSTVGRATLVNAKSRNKEAAFRFLAFLASEPYNELVNDQADGICPFRKYAQGQRFLVNPEHPEEQDNEVWRAAAEYAVPTETSPYVNGYLANRILSRQLDLVRIGQKSARDALRTATEQINREIEAAL